MNTQPVSRPRRPLLSALLLAALGALPAAADVPTALAVGQRLEREIAAGAVHRFVISVGAGQTLRGEVLQQGIDLVVRVSGPDGAPLAEIDSPNGTAGPEPIDVEAKASGPHTIEVAPLEPTAAPGRYEIHVARLLSPAERAAEIAAERAREEAAVAWLREHHTPLATVEAGHGFADLEPLRAMVGDARVVALGEATHGTREFFQLKHRLLEFLVSEMGFTAFAIEATLPESFDVDRYVQGEDVEGDRALAGLYFWTWNTEEVMDLLDWMRAWNADPAHPRKVHFYGFDMQMPVRAAKLALGALSELDPGAAKGLRARLERAANALDIFLLSNLSVAERAALVAAATELEAALLEKRDALMARHGVEQSERVLRAARVLLQCVQDDPDSGDFSFRDRAMAENARWVLDREGPQGKVVLWAHNGHVSKQKAGEFRAMGAVLAEELGDALRVIGFAFGEGSFQARTFPPRSALTTFNIGPPPPGSLDALLTRSGLELGLIDLRQLPRQGPAGEWFAADHASRSIGALFGAQGSFLSPGRIGEKYDLLLYVRRTSAARSMPSAVSRDAPRLGAPVNLDFEQGGPAAPAGWRAGRWTQLLGYRLAESREQPARGARSVCIHGEDTGVYGESAGELHQELDAAALRGKRLRFGGAVRTAGEIVAQVALQPASGNFRQPPAPAFERVRTRPAWTRAATEVVVPADALSVTLQLAAEGRGVACFDDLSFEVLETNPPAP